MAIDEFTDSHSAPHLPAGLGHGQPTRRPMRARCAECQRWFVQYRFNNVYCSAACTQAAKRREVARGRQVVKKLIAMVSNTKARGPMLTEVSQIARAWRDEDRARNEQRRRQVDESRNG